MVNDKPWFRQWPAEVPKHLEYPQIPVQKLLEKSAKNFPKKIALANGENEVTYSQLELLSNKFANALVKLGVKKGDRVALFLPNIPQFLIAYFGTLKAAGVVTAISPHCTENVKLNSSGDSGAETIVILRTHFYPILIILRLKPNSNTL